MNQPKPPLDPWISSPDSDEYFNSISHLIGALIFARGKPNPFPPHFGNHEIWHVCVMAGNSIMFLVMLLYVLPYPKR